MNSTEKGTDGIEREPAELGAFDAPTELLPPSRVIPKLVVVQGEKPGLEIAIVGDRMSIGRDLNADIKIREAAVSKKHAQLVVKDAEVFVVDLGSSNGTSVNGKRLLPRRETVLQNGDRIEIGKNQFRFERLSTGGAEFDAATEILPGALIGRLRVVRGNVPFSDYDVRSGALLGRSGRCDVCIPDTFVSDEHATITFADGRAFLTDLGSSNGTFLNERRLAPQTAEALTRNDKIRIGNVELQFEYFEKAAEFEVGTQFDIRKTYGKLKAVAGPLLGWEYDVRHGVTIGRSEGNDIVIASRLASDRHARIEISDDKPHLVDLDSKNGTRVNGRSIKRRTLYGGDRIEIGDATFRFLGKRSAAKTWTPVGVGAAVLIAAALTAFVTLRAAARDKLADAHFNIANLLFAEKKYDQALAEFQKVLSVKPDHREVPVYLKEIEKRKKVQAALQSASTAFQKEFFEDAKKSCDEILYGLEPDNTDARRLKERILTAEGQKKEADGLLRDIERDLAQQNYNEAVFLANLVLERDFDAKFKARAEELKARSAEGLAAQKQEAARTARLRVQDLETAIRNKYEARLYALAQEDIKRLLAEDPDNRVALDHSVLIERRLEATPKVRVEEERRALSAEDIETARKLLEEARKVEMDFLDYGKDIQPAIEKWERAIGLIPDRNHPLRLEAQEKLDKYARR